MGEDRWFVAPADPHVPEPALEWLRPGPDRRYVTVRLVPRRTRRREVAMASAITSFVLIFALLPTANLGPSPLRTARWVLIAVALTVSIVVLVLDGRRRVVTDPTGLTAVNRVRRQHVRWQDVDDVVLDGRAAVTVVTPDGDVTCEALGCPEWPGLELGRGRRQELRTELATVRDWLLATRDAHLARG